MKLLSGRKVPTPFGEIKLADLETPPIRLPKVPDERGRKAIGHSIGEDAASILGMIPWVGGLAMDALQDMHHAEIEKILTDAEYREFAEYDKSFPTAIAMVRTVCFKEV